MNVNALLGLSALMSLVASSVVAKLYAWPRLHNMDRYHALALLVSPHLFFRFIGLSFLVPGVVSPSLPSAFAVPAAYGDFGCRHTCHRRYYSPRKTRILGPSTRVGVQRVGCGGPPVCGFSRSATPD